MVGVLRGSTRRMPWKVPESGPVWLTPVARRSGITAWTPSTAGWNAPMGAMSLNLLNTDAHGGHDVVDVARYVARVTHRDSARDRVAEGLGRQIWAAREDRRSRIGDRTDIRHERGRARRVAGNLGVVQLVEREVAATRSYEFGAAPPWI